MLEEVSGSERKVDPDLTLSRNPEMMLEKATMMIDCVLLHSL